MTQPGEGAAAGRGHLRAARADREQVIEALKSAFARGHLTKDEFGARVGRTLASRTYAELAPKTGRFIGMAFCAVMGVPLMIVCAVSTSLEQRRSRRQRPPRPDGPGPDRGAT